MPDPVQSKLLDGATGNQSSEATRSMGHTQVTLFVALSSAFDGASDTVTVVVEGSPNGVTWDEIPDGSGSSLQVTETDVDQSGGSGPFTGSASVRAYYEFLRVRVKNFSDASGDGDLTIDAWVGAGGYPGRGAKGKGRIGGPQ